MPEIGRIQTNEKKETFLIDARDMPMSTYSTLLTNDEERKRKGNSNAQHNTWLTFTFIRLELIDDDDHKLSSFSHTFHNLYIIEDFALSSNEIENE